MLGAILVLMLMPILDLGRFRGSEHRPLLKNLFIILMGSFWILLVLGGKHVENPYIFLGQVASVVYFGVFFVLLPVISLIENTFTDLATSSLEDTPDSKVKLNTKSTLQTLNILGSKIPFSSTSRNSCL